MTRSIPSISTFSLAFIAAVGLSSVAWGQSEAPPEDDSGKDNNPPEDDSGKPKAPPKPKETAAQCVKHTTQSRFVSGYDHLVHIENTCRSDATCKVSTDVNPTVQTVRIKSKESTTVLTYRGSPARDFKVNLSCELSQ